MKIIHTADIHLGSPLSSIDDVNKRNKRKNEILSSFENLINYANQNNIKIIMMSGDVFDNNLPYKKDKEFFYHLIEKNNNINFLYLKGNHDISGKNDIEYPNLFLFNDYWKNYKFNNVVISGIELTKENSKALYPSLNLNKNDINIVMMHGDIYSKGDNFISLKDLKNKNIDYLALGHIHKNALDKLDDRGYYAYSGCLEGRGFDEDGIKGFYVLDINENEIKKEFIPNNKRIIHSIDIDITNLDTFSKVKDLIDENVKNIKNDDIVRIYLIGENEIDLDLTELENYYSFFYISIKDKTKRKININNYLNDLSLRGEFIRRIMDNNEYSQEEKEEIIYLGLNALNGKE